MRLPGNKGVEINVSSLHDWDLFYNWKLEQIQTDV